MVLIDLCHLNRKDVQCPCMKITKKKKKNRTRNFILESLTELKVASIDKTR